ncbi:aminotransferase class I/II-fold pyridoxal phosphate-dependent enzyme [Staphylococcus epidermidis]|nr:aminotransferase class I/II-fold pyridoxal phosphate-dependent enzyme [Staphylococcus epidermidis]
MRVLIEPGDTVLVEVPAYPATLQALRMAQARMPIPMDEHGLQTDTLAQLLAALPAQRPKLLYTVPNFSNPRGTLLAAERREALVSLARDGFRVVEDDLMASCASTIPAAPQAIPATARHGRAAGAAGSNPVVICPACQDRRPRCAWAGCCRRALCRRAAPWPSRRPICAPRR